jgi:hypothetical protein
MWCAKFKLYGEMWISHRYITVVGAAINSVFIGEENPREGCGIRKVLGGARHAARRASFLL